MEEFLDFDRQLRGNSYVGSVDELPSWDGWEGVGELNTCRVVQINANDLYTMI